MKFNNKLMGAMIIISWTMLASYIVAVDLLMLDTASWLVIGILGIAGVVVSQGWFLCAFIKNRKRIASLKDQYLDTLKPQAPLRFCPTDEELMDAYYLSKSKSNTKQAETKDEQKQETKEETLNQEKEEELEMQQ